MATFETYTRQLPEGPPALANSSYEHFEFYQTAHQQQSNVFQHSMAGHDYLATNPLVFVSTPVSQPADAIHCSANLPMFFESEPIQAHAVHESIIHIPEIQDLALVSPVHTSTAAPYWHAPGPDSRNNSITTLNEFHLNQTTTQPYYTSLPAPWSPHNYDSARPLVSPPLSHTSFTFVEPVDMVPPSEHGTRQSAYCLSDADADGEDDHEPCQNDADSDKVCKQAEQRDPPTPVSEIATAVSSSDDEVMSDNDSEYRPRAAAQGQSGSRRRSGISARGSQQARRSQVLGSTTGRIASRKSAGRASKAKTNSWSRKSNSSDSKCRPFYCPFAPYGCSSTFPNKNEWKRHARTQHLQQYFWRCNLCDDDAEQGVFNDFNRKDLYEQHVQRMHRDVMEVDQSKLSPSIRHQLESNKLDKSTEKQYQTGKDRLKKDYWVSKEVLRQYEGDCKIHLRDLPDSCSCPVCDRIHFKGESAWDDRMEHMSEHFDESRRLVEGSADATALHPLNWHADQDLHDYLIQETLISRDADGGWRLLDLPSRKS